MSEHGYNLNMRRRKRRAMGENEVGTERTHGKQQSSGNRCEQREGQVWSDCDEVRRGRHSKSPRTYDQGGWEGRAVKVLVEQHPGGSMADGGKYGGIGVQQEQCRWAAKVCVDRARDVEAWGQLVLNGTAH